MDSVSRKCLILCFIVSASIVGRVRSCDRDQKYQVLIANNMPAGPHKLQLHCASGNDDLGFHDLKRGDIFHFSFCDSAFSNTLFFCHLWWYNKDRAFDVFRSKWAGRCEFGRCYWEARADGIYYANEYPPAPGKVGKLYDWNVHG